MTAALQHEYTVSANVFVSSDCVCACVCVCVCVCVYELLTGNSEYISLDLSGDLEATSPLSVVCPTQARHIGHTALMDVHHTVWKTHTRTHTCIFNVA